MDARRPSFLLPFVDEAAIELGYTGFRVALSGDLRGPAARCQYLAQIDCGENMQVEHAQRYTLQLEMQVEELAALDVDLGKRSSGVADLWIDAPITQAWRAVDEESECMLTIRRGYAMLDALMFGNAVDSMRRIVDLVIAIAAVPERRAGELAAALSRFSPESRRRRLALDQPAFVVRERGVDVAVTIAHAPGSDSPAAGLRTVLLASRAAADSLVIVDPALDRKHRPRHATRSSIAIDDRTYLASGALPPELAPPIATARPSVVIATEREVIASLTGWVADPGRLEAAVELVSQLAAPDPAAPYR